MSIDRSRSKCADRTLSLLNDLCASNYDRLNWYLQVESIISTHQSDVEGLWPMRGSRTSSILFGVSFVFSCPGLFLDPPHSHNRFWYPFEGDREKEVTDSLHWSTDHRHRPGHPLTIFCVVVAALARSLLHHYYHSLGHSHCDWITGYLLFTSTFEYFFRSFRKTRNYHLKAIGYHNCILVVGRYVLKMCIIYQDEG